MINFGDFLLMRHELSLIAVFLILLVYDIFASEGGKKWYHFTSCLLFGLHTAAGFIPSESCTTFGGMFVETPVSMLMKNILNVGVWLIFLQAGRRLKGDTKEGEFYTIMAATLLGMYIMISAGNFMMFYIGVETASLPLACLATFDKYREKSAEAGAKYILMTALAYGIMMFGLSYLYGATGK